jgi:hypothetical protein
MHCGRILMTEQEENERSHRMLASFLEPPLAYESKPITTRCVEQEKLPLPRQGFEQSRFRYETGRKQVVFGDLFGPFWTSSARFYRLA